MAPSRSKVLKSFIGDKVHELPSRQQTIMIQSPVTTPNQSSSEMVIGITQAQKQALIDNLQLESEFISKCLLSYRRLISA